MQSDFTWSNPYVPTLADRARAALDGVAVIAELLAEYELLMAERDALEAKLESANA